MASYADGLIPRLRKILASSDLSTISAKSVRKELVRQGEDSAQIKAARDEIDARISEIYDEMTADQGSPSESSDDVPLRPSTSYGGADGIPPPSSQPTPLHHRPKTVKVEAKDEKPRVKSENGAVVPPPTRPPAGETDEEMAARLQREYDALTRNRTSRSAASGSGTTRAKKKKVVKKRKSKATVSDEDEEGGSVDENGDVKPKKKKRAGGGNSVFNKEMVLSDALAAFTGEARLSRPQTVKRIWDYVKANNLQDIGDRRFIICDERLRSVFNTDRLHMFTMNKILSSHFRDPDDIIYKEDPGDIKVAVDQVGAGAQHAVAPKVEAAYESDGSDDE